MLQGTHERMISINPVSRLVDVPGVSVGHWSNHNAQTGCTAILFDQLSTASVHVAGGAPGASETDLLDPSALVRGVNAILLSGGSAFGLATGDGARRYLEEQGKGFQAGDHIVPIAPVAVIYDLAVGASDVRPGPQEGYLACKNADKKSVGDEGRIGAGTGATVAKYLGPTKSSPGGLASRSVIEEGVSVGALMVANCFGAVTDRFNGNCVAVARDENGSPVHYLDKPVQPPGFGATVIGVVVTDAQLTKAEAKRIAIMAHDGIARAVEPSHTPYDGDMIFVVSTGDKRADTVRVGAWAALLVERSILSAASSR